ncbi:MAG: DUF2178 domain-containing protein [Methanomicrobiaceae archaeon]|nr:DUF2178 domain-containing protein [Methanomicrobiaceae archaeon]
MKRNTFYISASLIGILVACIFWWAVIYDRYPAAQIVTISVIAGAAAIYILRQKIDDTVIVDEMISKINEKSAMNTLQVLWVGFLALTISGFTMAMSIENPRVKEMMMRGAVSQFIFLASILLIYALFRIYYSGKYGGYEEDEESD